MVSSDYAITHRCALYTPGHNVHFIQARLAWENPAAYVRGEVLAIDDAIVVATEHGDVRRFRNHDLHRFARIVDDVGLGVTLCDRGVLRIDRHPSGGFMFCIAPDAGQSLAPCLGPDAVPPPPSNLSPEALAKYLLERARSEGGGVARL
jgi:hypothetical protein